MSRALAGWARGGGTRRQNPVAQTLADLGRAEQIRRWSGPENGSGHHLVGQPVGAHATAPVTLRGQLQRDGASIGEHLLGVRPLVLVANMADEQDPARVLRALPAERRRHTKVVLRRPTLTQILRLPVAEVNVDRPRLGGGRLIHWIRRGGTVLVFPEVEVSVDGELGRFHTFAADLARQAEVDMAPAAITGTFNSDDVPRVRFGAPIPVEPFESATGRAKQAVASLLAESQTSWWAELTNGDDRHEPSREVWQRIWSNSEPEADPNGRRTIWTR